MKLSRGDVVMARFPHAGGQRGKKRPALVVQADAYNAHLGHVIIAEITTNLRPANDPAFVLIDVATPDGQQSGLDQNSLVSGLFLATVFADRIRPRNWQALYRTINNAKCERLPEKGVRIKLKPSQIEGHSTNPKSPNSCEGWRRARRRSGSSAGDAVTGADRPVAKGDRRSPPRSVGATFCSHPAFTRVVDFFAQHVFALVVRGDSLARRRRLDWTSTSPRAPRMPETIATQILIDRVQAGDRSALNDLCARYQQRVLSAVRIRLGAKLRGKIESWDVVQEVMMAALAKVDSFEYRTEGAFLKYLNHLVENRLRDEADRQGAQCRNADREIPLYPRSPGDENPLMDLGDPSAATPSRLLVLREDLERMERAMDRLPQEQRDLLVAVKLEGQTYGELAAGTTVDAIRMKVNRAEKRLAAIYHELEAAER